MLGAIAGDIIGSVFEGDPTKDPGFTPLFGPHTCFTDDTVLTVAVADCLLQGLDYAQAYCDYFQAYPYVGYGGKFHQWALDGAREPYNSFGNGSAMRVSPVAYARDTLQEVLAEAKRSAEVTHNHPEGIRGAQATAAAIFLARTGSTKEQIRDHIERDFGYDLHQPWHELKAYYSFDVTCQGSVPESMIAFLQSSSYEETVRNAIALGGDADTMAAIAGAIAEAFYGGVPPEVAAEALQRLDEPLREVVREFSDRYMS